VSFAVIGKPVGRVEGPDKVSGAARYAADQLPPGIIWGKAHRSPLPHARIVRIDTGRARAVPGVLGLNDVHAHYVGTSVEIEVHIDVDSRLNVTEAHDIATQVRDRIQGMEEVSHAFIHVDPMEASTAAVVGGVGRSGQRG